MNVSAPFIQRPIATSLLGVAVMFGGLLGYLWLPVSALPQVDFPTIQVTTQLPGASPDTMVALVTARSEEHTSELQSQSHISYAVFCLKKKKNTTHKTHVDHFVTKKKKK